MHQEPCSVSEFVGLDDSEKVWDDPVPNRLSRTRTLLLFHPLIMRRGCHALALTALCVVDTYVAGPCDRGAAVGAEREAHRLVLQRLDARFNVHMPDSKFERRVNTWSGVGCCREIWR